VFDLGLLRAEAGLVGVLSILTSSFLIGSTALPTTVLSLTISFFISSILPLDGSVVDLRGDSTFFSAVLLVYCVCWVEGYFLGELGEGLRGETFFSGLLFFESVFAVAGCWRPGESCCLPAFVGDALPLVFAGDAFLSVVAGGAVFPIVEFFLATRGVSFLAAGESFFSTTVSFF